VPPGAEAELTPEQQAAAAAVAARLDEITAQLADAQARVDAAVAASAIALDTYQAKQAEYEASTVTAEEAAARARQAKADLHAARAEVLAFARASYKQGTTSPALQAMLRIGPPEQMLERAALLDAAGAHKADVLREFAVAEQQARVTVAMARTSQAESGVLEQQAAAALKAAEQLVVTSREQLTALEAQRTQLLLESDISSAAAQSYAEQQALRAVAAPWTDAVGQGGSAVARAAIEVALRQVGTRYAWGGGSLTGPSVGFGIDAGVVGFDCSGLTRFAYAQAGISIARNSRAQYATLPKVSRSDLQPGDLVFWANDVSDPSTIHHVATYLGNGRMVEAPRSGATVVVTAMRWSHFIGAVRPTA
jgi:cell wall-associated NlpC family hydrolase